MAPQHVCRGGGGGGGGGRKALLMQCYQSDCTCVPSAYHVLPASARLNFYWTDTCSPSIFVGGAQECSMCTCVLSAFSVWVGALLCTSKPRYYG